MPVFTKKMGAGTTPAIDTTGAKLIVIAALEVFTGPNTPTDNQGNTWTPLTLRQSTDGSTTSNVRFFYCINPNVNASHTFSITGSFPAIFVQAFTENVTAFDTENGGGDMSTSPHNTGSITPGGNGYLVVSAIASLNNTNSVNSPHDASNANQKNDWSAGVYIGGGNSYYIQPTAGSISADWSDDDSSLPHAFAIASFVITAGGAADIPITKSDDLNAWNDSTIRNMGTLATKADDANNLADSTLLGFGTLLSQGDQLTLTDSLSGNVSHLLNIADALSQTDGVVLNYNYLLSGFADTLSFLDSLIVELGDNNIRINVADLLSLSDSLRANLHHLKEINDSISQTDSLRVYSNVLVQGIYTLRDVMDRIRQTIDNPVYYTEEDLGNATQDGYDEIIAATGSILKAVVLPYSEKLIYYDFKSLIPDLVAISAIYNTLTKRWMNPVSLRWLDTEREDWEIQEGNPEYFSVVSHRYTAIHPRTATAGYGNMYVFYRANANNLTEDSAIRFNNDFIMALEEYAAADLLEQGQEFTKASKRFNNYTELLSQLDTWVKNLRESDRIPSLQF